MAQVPATATMPDTAGTMTDTASTTTADDLVLVRATATSTTVTTTAAQVSATNTTIQCYKNVKNTCDSTETSEFRTVLLHLSPKPHTAYKEAQY